MLMLISSDPELEISSPCVRRASNMLLLLLSCLLQTALLPSLCPDHALDATQQAWLI
jgi:hypothetical protein